MAHHLAATDRTLVQGDPRDQRRSYRVEGKISACCRVARLADFYTVENLSTGGALLSCGFPLPVGQPVEVLLMAGTRDPVSVRATVVRHHVQSSFDVPPGVAAMAISFLPDIDTHDAIHDIVVDAYLNHQAPESG